MTTEHLKTFFDTVSAWWGLDNDEEDDYLRLREIQRNTQQVPLNILELGAGSGGTAVCYAKAGHQVTAVEISDQRVKNMHQWAYESHVNNLNVIQADIYTVNLSQRYDVICYWNGFGVGDDAAQRYLLTRMRQEWLNASGFILLTIFSPWWWSRQAGQKIMLNKLAHVPTSIDNYRWRDYDPVHNRFYEYWQPVDGSHHVVCQHYRCYAPADFHLLLEGTRLSVEYWKVDYQQIDTDQAAHDTQHPLWHDSEYLVKLVSS